MPLKELAERRNLLHAKSDAQTILKHALDDMAIGEVALVSSFGSESIVLLHMAAEINPATPVIFIDTEMLFEETLTYQRDVAEMLGLTDVRIISPDRATLMEKDIDGLLHRSNPDACCDLRKAHPLEKALEGFGGWITGRKRIQGGQRVNMPLFEKETDNARIKINPLADWTPRDVADYVKDRNLPKHPLADRGFKSLGCAPCTTKVAEGEDPRAGRWRGRDKTECGIHFVGGKIERAEKAA